MSSSPQNKKFTPLLGVLEQVQYWLESSRLPNIMLATSEMEEFQNQKLPAHCEVSKCKIHGPRIPVRGQRQAQAHPYTLAHWPNDVMVEGMKSMLAVVMKGEPVLRVADYQVQGQPGDFLLIPSQIPRWNGNLPTSPKGTADMHHELALFWGSSPDWFQFSMRVTHYDNHIILPPGIGEAGWLTNPLPCQHFSLLEASLQNRVHKKCTAHLLASLIVLLREEIEKGRCFDSTAFPSDSQFSPYQDPIAHALQYIHHHLDTPLSIDIVARWVGLSRSSFTRRFRAQTNQSFNAYLIEQRLERAKTLLSQTDLSIVQISSQIGMLPVRLHQLFPQKYQCTPREFRLSQRNGQNDSN